VRREDVEAAAEVDREYMRRAIPDLEVGTAQTTGEEGCPACGAPLSPDAAECSDCGLTLVADA
jgi:predicted amidophosphoribosyltransferase